MAKPQTIKQIMSTPPVTCSPDERLERVARMMLTNHCGFIPLTVEGKVVGVLSDRDIAMRCVAEARNPIEITAADVMTTHFYAIDGVDPIENAMTLMEHRQVRRLPVLADGKLIGVVSQADLVANLAPHRGAELVKLISRATWRLVGGTR
jgi:CBS domain-containing protein